MQDKRQQQNHFGNVSSYNHNKKENIGGTPLRHDEEKLV